MTEPVRVTAVVPALDEATAIGEVVRGLLGVGACCVVVVDGGSRDGTAAEAAAAGARVIVEHRRGYGRACLTGGAQADMAHRHDAIAFLDGDGSCDPSDLGGLVRGLERADLILGRRDRGRIEHGALPWHARLGNRFICTVLRMRTGRPVNDLPPFKVVRTDLLASLALDEARYGWTVQLIARTLMRPEVPIAEVPVRFRRRRSGRSKVSGSVRASVAAGRAMVTTALRETRPRALLTLMAKAPRAGHAKTRLEADLGSPLTASLWRASLADVAATLSAVAARRNLRLAATLAEPGDTAPVLAILGAGWESLVQRRAGLSGALVDTFITAARSGAHRGIAVSGDNPDLPPELIEQALDALDKADAVLGPTPDGGYWLLGLRWRSARGLAVRLDRALRSTAMGSDSALASTWRGLAEAGWKPHLAEPWPDVDTVDDLKLMAERLATHQSGAHHTRAWLARHAEEVLTPERRTA